jgi:hypothetical protein
MDCSSTDGKNEAGPEKKSNRARDGKERRCRRVEGEKGGGVGEEKGEKVYTDNLVSSWHNFPPSLYCTPLSEEQ